MYAKLKLFNKLLKITLFAIYKYKVNNIAHINMNIFFYEEIRLHLFESDYFKGWKGVFYRPEQSYSVEYPNDIQIEANENLRKLAVNITKSNPNFF